MCFPPFTENELVKIALGLGERFKLKNNTEINNYESFIRDSVKFHMEWSKNVNDKEVQCFTIREIAAMIKDDLEFHK